jgi:hypothetical protein
MPRKDLEGIQASIGKLKNPQPEFGVVREEQQFMPKMESKPIADMSSANTMGTSSIKKVPMREKTQPELAKDYEMAKRARKKNPTLNEATTAIKLGINKAAQKAASITKVKIADKAREIFAPNTTVKREYADPTRVNLGNKSKLGDKKIIQKLDKDGTVLKTKTKQVVSKKRTYGLLGEENMSKGLFNTDKSKRAGTGTVSKNVSVRSPYAGEGVEGFKNKRTKYRKTQDVESLQHRATGAIVKGTVGFMAGLASHMGLKNKINR